MRAQRVSWWCGLWTGLTLTGCVATAPPNAQPLRLLSDTAQGETLADAGTARVMAPEIDVQWVSNLSESEEAAVKEQITRHLQKSMVDHYPRVEHLHIVPGPKPETYVFVARVSIAGFTSSKYRMIGHFDRQNKRITVLEHRSSFLRPFDSRPDPLCPVASGQAADTPAFGVAGSDDGPKGP